MGGPESTDVAVIGAGPYGLSLGAHLAGRNVRFRIFGKPMETWRSAMPEGMILKSPGRASNLLDPAGTHTLERFCAVHGRDYEDWDAPIPLEQFVAYGEWFQSAQVPMLERREVLACHRDAGRFRLELEGQETILARSVVISNGYRHSARVPPELSELPSDLVSHSSDHRAFEQFRGKKVVVVGAGQSALESAALLKESGADPMLVARTRSLRWGSPPRRRSPWERVRRPRKGLGVGWRFVFYEHAWRPFYYLPQDVRRRQLATVLGPLGAWWLRDRVVGQMPILLGATISGASTRSGQVALQLQTGEGPPFEVSADHVIAATGYRVRPTSFPFLSPDLRAAVHWEDGSPALSRAFESTAPGLHFIGLAAAARFGPVMRFIAGAQSSVPRLATHLAGRHATRS